MRFLFPLLLYVTICLAYVVRVFDEYIRAIKYSFCLAGFEEVRGKANNYFPTYFPISWFLFVEPYSVIRNVSLMIHVIITTIDYAA